MQRERLKRLSADVHRHFPPPPRAVTVRIVELFSDRRPLAPAELDRRVARLPRGPNERFIVLNIVGVKSRFANAAAVPPPTTSPASAIEEEKKLELEIERLERRKRELEVAAAAKKEDRVRAIRRAASDREGRARR